MGRREETERHEWPRAASLALVKDALVLLNKSSLIDKHPDVSGPDGYELRGAGRSEAGD